MFCTGLMRLKRNREHNVPLGMDGKKQIQTKEKSITGRMVLFPKSEQNC